jgi:hypothetical protein
LVAHLHKQSNHKLLEIQRRARARILVRRCEYRSDISNGMSWLCYKAIDGRLKLGCRINMTIGQSWYSNPNYEEFDMLDGGYQINAKSEVGPALVVFQKKLWIFWKEAGTTSIKYNKTDGMFKNWFRDGSLMIKVSGHKTRRTPSAYVFGDKLYLAWCSSDPENPDVIHIATTTDGLKWSDKSRVLTVSNDPSGLVLTSRYTPRLSGSNESRIKIIWGLDDSEDDKVGIASLTSLPSATTEAGDIYRASYVLSPPDYWIAGGGYTSETGNTVVERINQEWVLTIDNSNNLVVATDATFRNVINFGTHSQSIKSESAVGACLIPGTPGTKWGTPWRIHVVWRSADDSLKEAYFEIGR